MFKGEPSARGAGRKRGAWFLRRPPKHQYVELLIWSGERRERATGQRLNKRAGATRPGHMLLACGQERAGPCRLLAD